MIVLACAKTYNCCCIQCFYIYGNTVYGSPCRVHDNPYFGISTSPFSQKIVDVLLAPINESDIEIKPDGELTSLDTGSFVTE